MHLLICLTISHRNHFNCLTISQISFELRMRWEAYNAHLCAFCNVLMTLFPETKWLLILLSVYPMIALIAQKRTNLWPNLRWRKIDQRPTIPLCEFKHHLTMVACQTRPDTINQKTTNQDITCKGRDLFNQRGHTFCMKSFSLTSNSINYSCFFIPCEIIVLGDSPYSIRASFWSFLQSSEGFRWSDMKRKIYYY